MEAASHPYSHCASISAGPDPPPPPLAWQPLQLYQVHRRLPLESACALRSYCAMRSTPESDLSSRAPSGPGSNSRLSRSHAVRRSAAQSVTPTSRKREDMKPSFLAVAMPEVAHHVREAAHRAAVARIDAIECDRPGPAAHARQHGDVLLAVRRAVG